MAVRRPSQPGQRLYPTAGLHGRLVHELGESIARGRYRPGDVLPPVPELLQSFHASRTSIREAMRVLSAKGLIELRQRAGARVRPMQGWNLLDPDVLNWLGLAGDPALLAELLEIRGTIEPAAARLAADSASPAEIARILGCSSAMAETVGEPDLDGFYAADLAFHEAVLDACGNRFLAQLGRALMPALRRSFDVHRRFAVDPAFRDNLREITCPQHEAVARAIAEHRADLAEAGMRKIIANTRSVQDRFRVLAEATA